MGIFKKKNTTPDIEVASLSNAAEEGNPVAIFNLGLMARDAGDLKAAKSWFERAAELGNAGAMFNLGVIASDAGDLKSKTNWYERAAELDNSDAMVVLGFIAQEAGDLKEAKSWYERATEAGNSVAMFELCVMASEDGDLKGAKSWYERATEAGNGSFHSIIYSESNFAPVNISEDRWRPNPEFRDKWNIPFVFQNDEWHEDEKFDSGDLDLYIAGNPYTPTLKLQSFLNMKSLKSEPLLENFVLFNPSLPIEVGSKYLKTKIEQITQSRITELSQLSESELRKRFTWIQDEDDALKLLLVWREDYDEEFSYEYEEEVMSYLFDFYVLFTKGSKEQKALVTSIDTDTSNFFSRLKKQKILEPYIFWTLEITPFPFSRVEFTYEHDTPILLTKGSLFDPGSIKFLSYNEAWHPLSETDQNLIINIESGSMAITNSMFLEKNHQGLNSENEDVELKSIGFEFSSGLGDGFYPTICFEDAYGELQAIVTFFTHMLDADWLEGKLQYAQDLFESYIPYKAGTLDFDGSAIFVDSSWYHNGPDSGLHLLEFKNIPIDQYLAVEFVGVGEEGRTWASAIMRGRLARNYSLLFELFPQLTTEKRAG
jgi:hypothetical protein